MNITTYLVVAWRWFPWKDSFTIWPLASMAVNVVAAALLSEYVQAPTSKYPFLVEKALRQITLLTNASIAIFTLTFSLTVLSIQIASQTYSPRLLDEFVKDPLSKLMIAVNIGSISFCFTLNYWLSEESNYVPYVSIQLLTAHLVVVLVCFVNFIHFFINGFRIEKILARASASSLAAAAALSQGVEADLHPDEQPKVPSSAYKVMADASGYVARFSLHALVEQAAHMDVQVRYNHQIGDFINKGAILCYVWDAHTRKSEESLEQRVNKCLAACGADSDDGHQSPAKDAKLQSSKKVENDVEARLGVWCSQGICLSKKRNGDYDVTLGIQELSDIAVRALSPGVNDPHTAVQCMDVLSSLLAELARMDLDVPNARDADGHLRLCAPRRSFAYLTSMLDAIRRYGASDLGVCRRGVRLFGELGAILTRDHRLDRVPAVLAQLEQWKRVGEQNFESNSPEIESLRDLYDHMLRSIAESDSLVLKRGESVGKDLQEYEITHKEEKTQSKSIKNVSAAEPDTSAAGQAGKILNIISGLMPASESSECGEPEEEDKE